MGYAFCLRSVLMQTKVLVIDDDERVLSLMSRMLSQAGFRIHCAASPPALPELQTIAPQAIVLDWLFEGTSGLEWLAGLRADRRWRRLPVIMVSGRSDEEQRVEALRSGADDYMAKPASLAELAARLDNLVRRGSARRLTYAGHGLAIDVDARTLKKGGSAVKLTEKEWSLLACLLQSRGAVSRAQLAAGIWGEPEAACRKRLDVLVMRLRKVLGQADEAPLIETTGQGYRFARQSSTLSRAPSPKH